MAASEEPKAMKKQTRGIGKVCLVLIWAGIILICFLNRDKITAEYIALYAPENMLLAAVAMIALFALKSLSVVIYSGLLYVASGILFPLPIAVMVNVCGSAVMVSLPYFIGRKTGQDTVENILRKYPKAQNLHQLRSGNDFMFTFLVRVIGRLPSDVVSLYMGAVGVGYRQYLLGSLLGMLPHLITFPVMGTCITDPGSPAFLISLCAELVLIACSLGMYGIHRKRRKKNHRPDGE